MRGSVTTRCRRTSSPPQPEFAPLMASPVSCGATVAQSAPAPATVESV